MNKKKLFSFLIFIPLLLTGCLRGTNEVSSQNKTQDSSLVQDESNSKSNNTTKITYSYITYRNRSKDICEVVDYEEEVLLGDRASFRVKAFVPYKSINVEITCNNERNINIVDNIEDTYYFIADEENMKLDIFCYIEPYKETTTMYVIDDYNLLIGEPEIFDGYSYQSSLQYKIENNIYELPSGSTIRFKYDTNMEYSNFCFINGMGEVTGHKETEGYYIVNLGYDSELYLYTHATKNLKLYYENAENFEVVFYQDSKLSNKISSTAPNSVVYFKITLMTNRISDIDSVQVKYHQRNGNILTEHKDSVNLSLINDYYTGSFYAAEMEGNTDFTLIVNELKEIKLNVSDDEMTSKYNFKFTSYLNTGYISDSENGVFPLRNAVITVTPKDEFVSDSRANKIRITYRDNNYEESTYVLSYNSDNVGTANIYIYDRTNIYVSVSEETVKRYATIANTNNIKGHLVVPDGNGGWEIVSDNSFYLNEPMFIKFDCNEHSKPNNCKINFNVYPNSGETGYQTFLLYDADSNVYYLSKQIKSSNYCNFTISWEEINEHKVELLQSYENELTFLERDSNSCFVESLNEWYLKNETVYIRVNENADSSLSLKNINVRDSGGNTIPSLKVLDGIYSFTMPDDDVVVEVVYSTSFDGYNFVGKFFGAELYNNHVSNRAINAYTIEIDKFGEGKYGNFVFNINELSADSNETKGIVTSVDVYTSSETKATYNNNALFYDADFLVSYYSRMGQNVLIATDLNIAVRAKELDDTCSMYSFKGAINGWSGYATSENNKGYMAFEAYRNEELYKCIFIDKTTGYSVFYANDVRFVFTEGTSVNDKTNAIYDVYSKDELIGTVDKGTFTKANSEELR